MIEPMKIFRGDLIPTGPSVEEIAAQERSYRESLPPRLVTDWEAYVGDSLESAGLVDEYLSGWQAGFEAATPTEADMAKALKSRGIPHAEMVAVAVIDALKYREDYRD